MKTAWFIGNAFLETASFRLIQQEMALAAERQGLSLRKYTNADFVTSKSLDALPGAVLFWDKDIRLAKLMELKGARLYNPAEAIALCDDKTLTFIALKGLVPMPKTLLCPMTYGRLGYGSMTFLEEAADELGVPFIVKEGYGSYGNQVYLIRNLNDAGELLTRIGAGPILFQKFIQESAGRDVRAYVVNGRVVAAMKRVNREGNFRANIADGGDGEKYHLSQEEERITLEACRLLHLDFAGVDLLFSKSGPLLCEVNSNAHFEALKQVTGVNPADAIIDMIKESI